MVCIRAGSGALCEGLTSVLQQLVLNTFGVFIAETDIQRVITNLLLQLVGL